LTGPRPITSSRRNLEEIRLLVEKRLVCVSFRSRSIAAERKRNALKKSLTVADLLLRRVERQLGRYGVKQRTPSISRLSDELKTLT